MFYITKALEENEKQIQDLRRTNEEVFQNEQNLKNKVENIS